MEARQERGLVLAKDKRIKEIVGGTWAVPSQSTETAYLVNMGAGTCTCPDYELRKGKCKHLWAVEIVKTVETQADGTTVTTESIKVTRKTYVQDWPRYNAAQVAEKETVQALLRALCDGIQEPVRNGPGRRPVSLADSVFAMTTKVYTGMSGRRASTDIRACETGGRLAKAPKYNTIFFMFDDPKFTPILTGLIEASAAPLATVETSFAIDSTGFGTCVFRRWFDAKYGREMKMAKWLKAHACVGTKTNIVTSVAVTEGSTNDSPELPALVESTAERFTMAEVSADKAYLSHANLAAIEAVGAIPFVPFKSNSKQGGSPAWRRMHAMFTLREEEFLAAYHQRSNVESTFSAIKRKFGGAVRSKTYTAQVNEVLCKILCHNLSVLVHAIHELGIEPAFGSSKAVQA